MTTTTTATMVVKVVEAVVGVVWVVVEGMGVGFMEEGVVVVVVGQSHLFLIDLVGQVASLKGPIRGVLNLLRREGRKLEKRCNLEEANGDWRVVV